MAADRMEASGSRLGGERETAPWSSPSSPAGDSSPSYDYYEFATRIGEAEDEGEHGGERGEERLGGMGSLSFRTCSSAPSSPRSIRSLSIDLGDFPPMSELEEIPSRRWLSLLDFPNAAASRLPTETNTQSVLAEERERVSRRWIFPSFLRSKFIPAVEAFGGADMSLKRDKRDVLLWYRDLGRYALGDFSVAVQQANGLLEDQFHIESGPFGAFVGIYDGHGGPEAARYVCDHLYRNFQEISSSSLDSTSKALEAAFLRTEEGFLATAAETWSTRPHMATAGSCCLVGFISNRVLFLASLGDSRAVLGKLSDRTGEVDAIELSTNHNVNVEAARAELKEQNPDDPSIVTFKHGVWRVKGIIQISRSIGDAYMKYDEYNINQLHPRFRIPEPVKMPILSAKPEIISYPICQNDCFVIYASDGLWEHMSNQEAVNIVLKHPHMGAAKRLIKVAVEASCKKREMKYSDVIRVDKGVRRHFHDDITVIVLFLDHGLVYRDLAQAPSLSIRSTSCLPYL